MTNQPVQAAPWRHGGVVAEVKDMDFELVAKPTAIQLYLRGHGKSPDLSKATAKVTLLTGTEKQEIELKPVGKRLVVTVAGKPAAVRFAMK